MKYVMLLFILWVIASSQFVRAQGDAPPFVQGQAQTSKSVASVLEVPASQATKTAGSKTLLETGNRNMLVNPDFEHSTYTTGWTVSTTGGAVATPSLYTTNPKSGKKAICINCSTGGGVAGTCSLKQSVNHNAYMNGVQGVVSIYTASAGSGAPDVTEKLYPLVNGSRVGSGVTLNHDSNSITGYKPTKVPYSLGSTSYGLEVVMDLAASRGGDYCFDDAFAGPDILKADTGKTIYQTSTIVQAASFGATTITGALSTQTGSEIYSYNSSTGVYTVLKEGTVHVNASMRASTSPVSPYVQKNSTIINQQDGVNTVGYYGHTSAAFSVVVGDTFKVLNAGGTTDSQKISVTAYSNISISTYSSTNADTDWAACNFSTLAWQGLGTVTNNLKCKRQGSDLVINGRVTMGTTTASTVQIPLPTWNGSQLTSKNSSVISGNTAIGRLTRAASAASSAKDYVVLIDAAQSYLTLGFNEYSVAASPYTAVAGNASFNAGEVASLENIRIPIEGWENSNVIIGQFNGLESCTDSYQCTDMYSAKVSSTDVVSDENLDWITGNCTNATAGRATCTFKTGLFTVTPNCTITSRNNVTENIIIAESASAITWQTSNSAGAAADSDSAIHCQKQGADYIGKTAKAVASDQNDRTPGITNWASYYAKYDGGGTTTSCTSSPCTTTEINGDWLNGNVTRTATGNYPFTTNAIWVPNSWVICQASTLVSASPSSPNDGGGMGSYLASSTGVVTGAARAWDGAGAAFDGYGIIKCEGQLK